jgi:hypothetical protein
MKKRYDSLAQKQAAYRARKAGRDEVKGMDPTATVDMKQLDVELPEEPLYARLPWPLNKEKAPRWGEGVEKYIPLTTDEKLAVEEFGSSGVVEVGEKPEEATEEEWSLALERAERALRYARKMPEHVGSGDMKFQDPVWQWENETRGKRFGDHGNESKAD